MTKMTEKLLKIGNRAIKKAQKNNRKKADKVNFSVVCSWCLKLRNFRGII